MQVDMDTDQPDGKLDEGLYSRQLYVLFLVCITLLYARLFELGTARIVSA